MFLVDTEHGRIVGDEEIKSSLAAEHPTTSGCTPA
jgi:glutamate synthase (NADPH/NADH) large chain